MAAGNDVVEICGEERHRRGRAYGGEEAMKKPQLPKRWKGLRWKKEHHADGFALLTSVDPHRRSVVLYSRDGNGCMPLDQFVSVSTIREISLARLVRAVELAAIHAGLVEDRDA